MAGDQKALDVLLPEIYDELRALAAHLRRRNRSGDSVRATSLVHETFLRLNGSGAQVESPAHLAALAARVMRNVLVDRARSGAAAKRGGGWTRVDLDGVGAGQDPVDLLALDAALEELAAIDPRGAEVVHLRVFGGLELAEIAELLGLSSRTAERDWRAARAWLAARLG
jgi:RNA polymerase sigma factor (TIGR02999 family)